MSELEEYQSQLKDIEETLKQDPENESLKELRKELRDLVSLLTQDEQQPEPTLSVEPKPTYPESKEPSVTPAGDTEQPTSRILQYNVGDSVYVKNKLTKDFERVKITIISGNSKLITVKFSDDKNDTFPVEDIYKEKPKVNKYRLKHQKKENQEKKNQESDRSIEKSAQSWKIFNKKPKKKAVNDKSQFKTSDSIGSRVGVVNSGKPMTESKKREKTVHRYNPY